MTNPRIVTGALLVAAPLVFTLGYTGLQMTFGYPGILRLPAGEVLARFGAGGPDLHLYWYAMMAAALGMIPASVGLALTLRKNDEFMATLLGVFGVIAGLVQAMGLMRWVILVPGLAASYLAPDASAIDQNMATALFDATNRYLGMGVGEHLGYLFTALWTVMVATLVWSRWRYLAYAGVLIAIGVAAGMLEPFGVPGVVMINGISFTLWALWTLVLGVMLLRGKAAERAGMAVAA